jgi:hypothetical protein
MFSTNQPDTVEKSWGWPFSLANLTAGLRRELEDTTVHIVGVKSFPLPQRRPSIGRIQGLQVGYTGKRARGTIKLVLKEPLGTTRAGLAGAGRREVGVYQSLARHLPLRTPDLIAGSAFGDWLILEFIPNSLEPESWEQTHYLSAIDDLTTLHDRFWNLGADLDAFAWLSHPLEADYDVHVTAATQALQRVIQEGTPRALVENPGRMQLLATLIENVDGITAPLRLEPMTLLHGDYWPGNIAVQEGGESLVFDWQLTGVGPGVMDLLTFIIKSRWWYEQLPLPESAIIARYRHGLEEKNGHSWEAEGWDVIWDHALMWRFLQEWLDLIAATPGPLLETRAHQLEHIWLEPLADAVSRRLK